MGIRAWIGVVIVVASGAFLLGWMFNPGPDRPDSTPTNSADHPLLAKRIFIEDPSNTIINFSPLRSSVREYFSQNQLRGSLYFEYLPTGTSIRVNGDYQFRAASLIKLPVAMELYKAEELGKLSLDQKVQLRQEWLNSDYGNLYKKGTGYELTLREAARVLLTDSDNTALRAILASTETALETKDRALGSLDIEFSQTSDEGIDIGTRSYSSFLKCLYFACYVSKEHSQELLEYLTQTTFDKRLVAGIPDKEVKIAHKIGVYNTQIQSDCGIIYLAKNNYVLCVMLQGNDDVVTNNHIAELSRVVYEYVKTPRSTSTNTSQ